MNRHLRHLLLRKHLGASLGVVSFMLVTQLGFATPVMAQDEEQDQDQQGIEELLDIPEVTRPKNTGKKKQRVEEIVVTPRAGDAAQRRGRVGETASRDMLADSFEDDVEGFLDDLGSISTLDGDEEGNIFSFQGMAPEMSQLTLGGQKQGRGGPKVGDMPVDMIESIEVIKSPVASMEEGASGGTVNVELRSPANLKKQISGIRAGLARLDGTGKINPNISSFFGRTFADRKIGLLLNVNYKNNHSRSDGISTKNWDQISVDGYDDMLWMPRTLNNSLSKDSSELLSGSAILGFRPTQRLDISLKANFSQNDRLRTYTSLQGQLSKQRVLDILSVDGDIVTEMESDDKKRNNLRAQMQSRQSTNSSQSYSFDIKWQKSGTRLSASAGYGRSRDDYAKPSPNLNFSKNSDFGYSLITDQYLPSLAVDGDVITATDFVSRNISFSDNNNFTSNQYGEINLDKLVKSEVFRRFKMGVKYRRNTLDRSQEKGKYNFDEPLYLDSVDGDFIASDFLGHIDEPSLVHSWPYTDVDDIIDTNSIVPNSMKPNLVGSFDVEQETYAAYMQGDIRVDLGEGKPLIGNIGLRYVKTDILSHGHQETQTNPLAVETQSSYDDLLPSASIAMRLQRRLILQVGISRVITRPRLDMLSPSLRLNESEETGSTGNGDLQPFRANQVRSELTWVETRKSRFTFSVGYKDVESYFIRDYTLRDIDDTTYLVANPVNAHNASILSFNMDVSQDLSRFNKKLTGFSFKANFSYNISKTQFIDPVSQERLAMPGVTPKVAKFSLSYSKDKFSARIRYQLLSKKLQAVSSLSGLPAWQQGYGSLGIGATYKVLADARLSFDIRNLTNAGKLTFLDTPLQLSKFSLKGRQMTLGLKASF